MTLGGLVRYHVLFVMELSTRNVKIAGIVFEPNGRWMEQIARNLTDESDGFLPHKRYLIHDRSPVSTSGFAEILRAAGVKLSELPPRSPNVSSRVERFVRSIKSECLEKTIRFSERQLRHGVAGYRTYCHEGRNHQGLGNELILVGACVGTTGGEIRCLERLGRLLRYCHRAA